MIHSSVIVTPDVLADDVLKLMEERLVQIDVLSIVDAEGCCLGLIRLHQIVESSWQ